MDELNAKFKVIATKADYDELTEIDPGTFFYISDEKQYYVQTEDGLTQTDVSCLNQGLNFNLYDLNKNIINQLNPLAKEELFNQEKLDIINNFQEQHNNTHYMLLCKDYNYYTIFEYTSIAERALAIELFELVLELGSVYSIEETDDGAIEIWIKPIGEDNPYAFYLFPYDAGVVYFG